MYSYIVIALGIVAGALAGCATTSQSVLLGAGSGAAVGAGTGYLVAPSNGSGAIIGAATGAATGALLGYVIHQITHKNEVTNSSAVNKVEKYPFLTKPDLRTIFVPDRVEGERYIEGHRVFVIDKNSAWSP